MTFHSSDNSERLPGIRVSRDALKEHQADLDTALANLEERWSDWITAYSTRCSLRAGRDGATALQNSKPHFD